MKSFLKIPLKIHHGVLLVTDIAAQFESGRAMTLEQVAKKELVSQGFLEEIAGLLRKAVLIAGRRGPGGGYVLAKKPDEITVADIVIALEGPIMLVECLGEESQCQLSAQCSNRDVWATVQRQMFGTLHGITIAELARQSALVKASA